MSGNKSFDFGTKFTKVLPQNIKLNDILSPEEQNDAKLRDKFGNIFDCLDSIIKQDGQLDIDEINTLISGVDINEDNKISEKEIKEFCKLNGFNIKIVMQLFERIYNKLPGIAKQEEIFANQFHLGTYDGQYYMKKTNYGKDYVLYDVTTRNIKALAVFDVNNDTMLNSKCDKKIQITGVNEFINNTKAKAYPKIIINNEDGTKNEIKLRFKQINISNVNNRDDYMYILTHIVNNISNLPPENLEDLKNNVETIIIEDLCSENAAGQQSRYNKGMDNYKEVIVLSPLSGGLADINMLIHELGHAVDANIAGSAISKHNDEIKKFLDIIPRDLISNDRETRHILEDPMELYAGWYANDPKELFEFFDKNLRKDSNYWKERNINSCSWDDIEAIFKNIRAESTEMTNNYNQDTQRLNDYCNSINDKPAAISLEDIENIGDKTLWNCLWDSGKIYEIVEFIKNSNTSEIDSDIMRICSSRLKNTTAEEKLMLIKTIRNFPVVQEVLQEIIINVKKHRDEVNRFDNLPLDEALDEVKTIVDKEFLKNYKGIKLLPSKISLIDRIGLDELERLIDNSELHELINKACCEYEVPKSIVAVQEKSPGEITIEDLGKLLFAFQNDVNIRNFLVNKGYFAKRK